MTPEVGQVWSNQSGSVRRFVMAVFANGEVTASTRELLPGDCGAVQEYTGAEWDSLVEQSELVMEPKS